MLISNIPIIMSKPVVRQLLREDCLHIPVGEYEEVNDSTHVYSTF